MFRMRPNKYVNMFQGIRINFIFYHLSFNEYNIAYYNHHFDS